jgi:hypothetical protein
MQGALVYPETFWAFDCVGLRGDRLARDRADHAEPRPTAPAPGREAS